MTQPRTRADKLPRDPKRVRRFSEHVGNDAYPETCPRCGWPCTHLVKAYFDSVWNEHGGICTLCCQDAVIRFDRDGWPPDPRDEIEPEVDRAEEPEKPMSFDFGS